MVTCIHNVLSQQRWLEHYGEVVIRNTNSNVCTCKITFVKVSSFMQLQVLVAEEAVDLNQLKIFLSILFKLAFFDLLTCHPAYKD